jgi:hypothetical protein
MNGYANGDHMVKVGEEEMSVNDLVKKHMEACNSLADMEKAKNAESFDGGEPGKGADDDKKENDALDVDQMGDVGSRGGDKSLDNEEDEKKKEEVKKNARDKAARVKNAGPRVVEQLHKYEMPEELVARGKARYGSGK